MQLGWATARKPEVAIVRCVLILTMVLSACSAANAGTLVLQGSTTFTHRVMEPFQTAIEAASGEKLTVVPNKSSLGLLALFDRRADFGMISGPLQIEIDALTVNHPNLPYAELQVFNIWNTRMAFAVNKDNPVHRLANDKMRDILAGKITNWREIGGRDLPIRVVQVREGGGVQASIEAELLGGKHMTPQNPILVQISSQVVKVVEQLPEGLGLSQLSIVKNSQAVELQLDRPVEQHLDLVTFGNPTPDMVKVIKAARGIASMAFER
jgi:phosphate transport system substrate-binding protein